LSWAREADFPRKSYYSPFEYVSLVRIRPVVMTIAGSDSGGGAGLQADLKTFTSLGVFGTTVITAITAQNTFKVSKVMELPQDIIEAQFDAVMEDFDVKFAKTGVLPSPKVIEVVERKLGQYNIGLVLDPVMFSKSGYPLIGEDAMKGLSRLLGRALIITPNRMEAERLSGMKINSKDDLKRCALHLNKLTSTNVIVKGGRALGGFDVAVIDNQLLELEGESVNTDNLHGSGDVFSAAITAYLSKGLSLRKAVIEAKHFVTQAIKFSLPLGKGKGPVDPFAFPEKVIRMEQAREELEKLVMFLEKRISLVKALLNQDEKMNIGFVTEYGDSATLAGGIMRYLDWIKVDGPIVVNMHENLVIRGLRVTGKRIGISASLTDALLRASEKGKLKISESGIYGNLLLMEGRGIIVADSLEELTNLLEGIEID